MAEPEMRRSARPDKAELNTSEALEAAALERAVDIDLVVPETGEVVAVKNGRMVLPGEVTAVGLALPETLTFEEWSGIGSALQGVNRSLMWWIGDWLRYGERRWGDTYTQAVEQTGKAYDSLRAAKAVAERIQFDRRRSTLSFSHHAEVAFLPREIADSLLDIASERRLSTRELRAEVSRAKAASAIGTVRAGEGTCTVDDLHRLIASGARFGTIYADPPWLYDNQGTRAATGNHYGGMTVDELCNLPMQELAADDAHLHLWTTNGFIFDCPRIFAAWGFEYRSSFVWVKPQIGIGNYWRNSHEFLLTAIRGDAKRFADKSLKSWLECERSRHSEKPEQVRVMLERASPGPYLELFGRSPARNWTVWGNQIERGLLFRDVREVA